MIDIRPVSCGTVPPPSLFIKVEPTIPAKMHPCHSESKSPPQRFQTEKEKKPERPKSENPKSQQFSLPPGSTCQWLI